MQNNILIVDDIPDNLKLLTEILKGKEFVVRVATTGVHAIRTIQKEKPDLILLDIMMPGENGYEICKKLKSNESTAQIPIIFISALDDTFDKVRAFSIGGVDYITKPFHTEEVLARITTHLTLSRLQKNLEKKNAELQKALDEVKTLRGFIPICANCKKIRENQNWEQMESYIQRNTEAKFSHSICPECIEELYGDFLKKEK